MKKTRSYQSTTKRIKATSKANHLKDNPPATTHKLAAVSLPSTTPKLPAKLSSTINIQASATWQGI